MLFNAMPIKQISNLPLNEADIKIIAAPLMPNLHSCLPSERVTQLGRTDFRIICTDCLFCRYRTWTQHKQWNCFQMASISAANRHLRFEIKHRNCDAAAVPRRCWSCLCNRILVPSNVYRSPRMHNHARIHALTDRRSVPQALI